MTLYKLFALLFLVITPLFSYIVYRFLGLKRFKLNFADITFPLYTIETIMVSGRFFTHSFLPYILIALSISAISITLRMLYKTQRFKFRRFLKLFWRIGFFISTIGYVITVFLCLLQ